PLPRIVAVPVLAVGAGHEDALWNQRLTTVRQMLRHQRQGIKTWVAEGTDLAKLNRRLRQTRLHDPRRLTLAGELLLPRLCLSEHDRLLGLLASADQVGVGLQYALLVVGLRRDDRLLCLLARLGQLRFGLVLDDLNLHVRAG